MWMLIEAAVTIGSGIAAHSLSLIAFGADSLIELASAAVLLWRLHVELRQGAEFPERVEHRVSQVGGALLFVLAAYIVVSSAYSLWMREAQEFSTPGLALALLAIPVVWLLARAKMRLADELGSRALRADRRVDNLRVLIRHRRNRAAGAVPHAGMVVDRQRHITSDRRPARQRGSRGVGSR